MQCVHHSDSRTKCLFCSLLSGGYMFLTKHCNTRDTQGLKLWKVLQSLNSPLSSLLLARG